MEKSEPPGDCPGMLAGHTGPDSTDTGGEGEEDPAGQGGGGGGGGGLGKAGMLLAHSVARGQSTFDEYHLWESAC